LSCGSRAGGIEVEVFERLEGMPAGFFPIFICDCSSESAIGGRIDIAMMYAGLRFLSTSDAARLQDGYPAVYFPILNNFAPGKAKTAALLESGVPSFNLLQKGTATAVPQYCVQKPHRPSGLLLKKKPPALRPETATQTAEPL